MLFLEGARPKVQFAGVSSRWQSDQAVDYGTVAMAWFE